MTLPMSPEYGPTPRRHEVIRAGMLDKRTPRYGCRACDWRGPLSEGVWHVVRYQWTMGWRRPWDAA